MNSKEILKMTTEEVIGLRDFDDAFVLAQSEKNAQAEKPEI